MIKLNFFKRRGKSMCLVFKYFFLLLLLIIDDFLIIEFKDLME